MTKNAEIQEFYDKAKTFLHRKVGAMKPMKTETAGEIITITKKTPLPKVLSDAAMLSDSMVITAATPIVVSVIKKCASSPGTLKLRSERKNITFVANLDHRISATTATVASVVPVHFTAPPSNKPILRSQYKLRSNSKPKPKAAAATAMTTAVASTVILTAATAFVDIPPLLPLPSNVQQFAFPATAVVAAAPVAATGPTNSTGITLNMRMAAPIYKLPLLTGWNEGDPLQKDESSFEVKEFLGSGSFGQVYKIALDTDAEPINVAMKVFTRKAKGEFGYELAVLRMINSMPAPCDLLCTSHFFMVTPHFFGFIMNVAICSLYDLMKDECIWNFKFHERGVETWICEPKMVLCQFLEALVALKSIGIIQYDIKPQNTLIFPTGIKITDWSLSDLDPETATARLIADADKKKLTTIEAASEADFCIDPSSSPESLLPKRKRDIISAAAAAAAAASAFAERALNLEMDTDSTTSATTNTTGATTAAVAPPPAPATPESLFAPENQILHTKLGIDPVVCTPPYRPPECMAIYASYSLPSKYYRQSVGNSHDCGECTFTGLDSTLIKGRSELLMSLKDANINLLQSHAVDTWALGAMMVNYLYPNYLEADPCPVCMFQKTLLMSSAKIDINGPNTQVGDLMVFYRFNALRRHHNVSLPRITPIQEACKKYILDQAPRKTGVPGVHIERFCTRVSMETQLDGIGSILAEMLHHEPTQRIQLEDALKRAYALPFIELSNKRRC